MYYLVEEMKGVAGVDEKSVATEIVEADSESAALERARDYHGMLALADEVTGGAGRYNHYLMATTLDIGGEVRRLGLASDLRIENIGDGYVRLNDDHGHVQGRADEVHAALASIPDGSDWDAVVDVLGASLSESA